MLYLHSLAVQQFVVINNLHWGTIGVFFPSKGNGLKAVKSTEAVILYIKLIASCFQLLCYFISYFASRWHSPYSSCSRAQNRTT